MKTRTPLTGPSRPDDPQSDEIPLPSDEQNRPNVDVATAAEVEATMAYLLRKNAELYRRLAE